MAPSGARRMVLSDDEAENDTPTSTSDAVEETRQTRKRTRTSKGEQLDQDQAAKTQSETERLKKKMKRMEAHIEKLKNLAAAQAALDDADADLDDDDDDPDKMPVESEEEDVNEEATAAAVLRPSLIKNATTPLRPAPAPQIRRREGDKEAAPSIPRALAGAPAAAGPAPPSPTSSPPPSSPSPTSSNTISAPQPSAWTSSSPRAPPPVMPPPSTPALLPPQAPLPGIPTLELRAAPFRDGKEPRSKDRPNASDYIDEVRDLISLATVRYSVSLYTVNAFPHTAQQREFAIKAWEEVCAARDSPVSWKLSDRMIAAIARRKSNIRGDVSDRIRPLIPQAYKFRTAINKANEQYNSKLSARLAHDGTFHHKKFDLEADTRSKFAEHRFLDTAIVTAFFWNQKTAVGYEYASHFNPMPEPAIAFVLTVIHAHILEWVTGQRVQEKFTENANSGFYTGFIEDLRRVFGSNESASVNIRKRLFERTFRAGGGVAMTPTLTQVSSATMAAAVAELAARSGLTDSEGEDEGDTPE